MNMEIEWVSRADLRHAHIRTPSGWTLCGWKADDVGPTNASGTCAVCMDEQVRRTWSATGRGYPMPMRNMEAR